MVLVLPLNKDGLVDHLLYYLWQKDEMGKKPSLYLPHTILYSCSQPSVWYFTSMKTSRLKRKNKSRLIETEIVKSFTKGALGPSDIVAYFIHGESSDQYYTRSQNGPNESSGSYTIKDLAPCAIEYFNIDRLHGFFKHRDQGHYNSGILQKFVYPRGVSNSIVRAIWSPKLCLLERRTNHFSLYDAKRSIHERAVTYDGPDRFSYPDPIHGAMLAGQAQQLCQDIVEHVYQVTHQETQISRMVLHLKADGEKRLWLLWCSSVRTSIPMKYPTCQLSIAKRALRSNRSALDLTEAYPINISADPKVPLHVFKAAVPDRLHRSACSSDIEYNQGAVTRRDCRDSEFKMQWALCTSCGRSMLKVALVGATYKAIIHQYQTFLSYLRQEMRRPEEDQAIVWPPEDRLVKVVGNVGFGLLDLVIDKRRVPLRSNNATADNSTSIINTCSGTFRVPQFMQASFSDKDWMIPPILQYLHPTLTLDEYKRHRLDPIFVKQEAAVCEECCLVFLDYATNALEGSSSNSTNISKKFHSLNNSTYMHQQPILVEDSSTLVVSSGKESLDNSSERTRDSLKGHGTARRKLVALIKTESKTNSMKNTLKNVDTIKAPKALDVSFSKPQIPMRILDFNYKNLNKCS